MNVILSSLILFAWSCDTAYYYITQYITNPLHITNVERKNAFIYKPFVD